MKLDDNTALVLIYIAFLIFLAVILMSFTSCGGTHSPEDRLKTILCESSYACMPNKAKPVDECMQEEFAGYWGQSEECMDCLENLEPCEVLSAEKQEECGCNE